MDSNDSQKRNKDVIFRHEIDYGVMVTIHKTRYSIKTKSMEIRHHRNNSFRLKQ